MFAFDNSLNRKLVIYLFIMYNYFYFSNRQLHEMIFYTQEKENGGYDYEFIKPGPSDDYICAICCLVARNAHQSSCCGKIFCEVCINKLKKPGYQINCPMCRQNFSHFKDIKTNRDIQSLKIYCTNHNDGCLWEDVLQKVEEHIKTCPYQIIECEKECKKKLPR